MVDKEIILPKLGRSVKVSAVFIQEVAAAILVDVDAIGFTKLRIKALLYFIGPGREANSWPKQAISRIKAKELLRRKKTNSTYFLSLNFSEDADGFSERAKVLTEGMLGLGLCISASTQIPSVIEGEAL